VQLPWFQRPSGLLAFASALAAVVIGCTTTKIDWAGRVGVYTFDQAVLELGPPDKQALLTDGTRVADWMTRRGGMRRVAVGPYFAYGPYCSGPSYSNYIDYRIPDSFLRLTFDPDGQLQGWKKLAR
jgi:hypothetical protein